jgi:hypothetical protein
MGATRDIDEDVLKTNAKNAPSGSYRISTQAEWPILYETLQGAILHLIRLAPVWYELERKTVYGDWQTVVSRSESRHKPDYIGEDRS